jgi:hypothetical protein
LEQIVCLSWERVKEEKIMALFTHQGKKGLTRGVVPLFIFITILMVVFTYDSISAAKSDQRTFGSPDEAFKAMTAALRTGNEKELLAIFGSQAKDFFSTDKGVEQRERERFLKAYEEKNRLEKIGEKKTVLHVGKDDWPWPVPVVKSDQRWLFASNDGEHEILARKIGRNEIAAVQVCLAYVDAQHEYARGHCTGGLCEYAQKFFSDTGKKNGLCWDAKKGDKQSPLGPLFANACRSGNNRTRAGSDIRPYHGYFYNILDKQGKNAPGGAYDYIVNGRMVGGFALVAYPALYGSSGIMTFIVNQEGVIYEKDLGKDTEKIAEAMNSFDPDSAWKKAD